MTSNNFFNDHIGPIAVAGGATAVHRTVSSRSDKRMAKVQKAKDYVLSKKMSIPHFVAETYNDLRDDIGGNLEEFSKVIPSNTFQNSQHYKDFNENYTFKTRGHVFGEGDLYILAKDPNRTDLPLKNKVIKRPKSSGSALALFRGGGSEENDPYLQQIKEDIHARENEYRNMSPEEIENAYDNSNFKKIKDTLILSGQSLGLILITSMMFQMTSIITRKIINTITPHIPKKIKTFFSTKEEKTKNPYNEIQEIFTLQLNLSKDTQKILIQQSYLLNNIQKQNNHKFILETITNFNQYKLNRNQAYVILTTICEISATDTETILKNRQNLLSSFLQTKQN